MSLLTPVKVPVKVYRWDDAGAPALDKSVGCIGTILKACLVTGYGTKEGAGWTLKQEDAVTKTKIFGFDDMTGLPLSLRLRNEDANKVTVQLVKDVVDANTATVVLECDTAFKFFSAKLTGQWMVIANAKGLWFFAQILHTRAPANETGVFLFASVVPGAKSTAFVIKHTGGTFGDTDADRKSIGAIGDTSAAVKAAAYMLDSGKKTKSDFDSMWDGITNKTSTPLAAPLYLYTDDDVYQLPIYLPSKIQYLNFDTVGLNTNVVNFCTSTQYSSTRDNAYVPIDAWGF